jgi:hypothetical protein
MDNNEIYREAYKMLNDFNKRYKDYDMQLSLTTNGEVVLEKPIVIAQSAKLFVEFFNDERMNEILIMNDIKKVSEDNRWDEGAL